MHLCSYHEILEKSPLSSTSTNSFGGDCERTGDDAPSGRYVYRLVPTLFDIIIHMLANIFVLDVDFR